SFFLLLRRHPSSTLFPYTTLFRSVGSFVMSLEIALPHRLKSVATWMIPMSVPGRRFLPFYKMHLSVHLKVILAVRPKQKTPYLKDRKSTRLNSSHVKISYAVFCLK